MSRPTLAGPTRDRDPAADRAPGLRLAGDRRRQLVEEVAGGLVAELVAALEAGEVRAATPDPARRRAAGAWMPGSRPASCSASVCRA